MTKDRLHDLSKVVSWPDVSYSRLQRENRRAKHRAASPKDPSAETGLQTESVVISYLVQIDALRFDIDRINDLAREVEYIYEKMMQPMADPGLHDDLDERRELIKTLAYGVSTKLRQMEDEQMNCDASEKANAQWRIKESQIFVTTRRFRDMMGLYHQDMIAHREQYKNMIVRQLEISGSKRSNDEIDETLDSSFPGTGTFIILAQTQRAIEALLEIEAHHHDIIKLESSIEELHGMFDELARLVTTQGQMVHSIEHHVSKAANYVEVGVVDTDDSEQNHAKAIKRRIFLCILVATIIAFLFVILLVAYIAR